MTACNSTDIYFTPNLGTSTATVDGVSSVGIYASVPSTTTTGTFTQTLTITGATVLDSTAGQTNVNGGSGVSMGWVRNNPGDAVTVNASAIIGSGVVINSHAGYGGGVFLRTEYAGNLSIDNAGTVTSLGVTNANVAFTDAQVNAGSVVDGLTAMTHIGAVSVINRGSVTAYSGRGLYVDGNYAAAAAGAPRADASIENTAGATVDAYLAGARAIAYYGTASITNAGTIHSTARQAIVAWSADGDAIVTNSGRATADDRNAIAVATEIGTATILNSGSVVASMASSGTLGTGIGYSGLRATVATSGAVSITNTGTATAAYDAAVVAHTPTGDATVTNGGTLTGKSGVFIDSGAGLGAIDTINDTNATGSNTLSGIAKFVNTGTVTAVDYGAYLDGTTNRLTNAGTITASAGTGVVTGTGASTTIANSGTISGALYGLDLGAASTVTNSGTLSGGTAAVRFGVGGNTLNVYDAARFLGGVEFGSTTSNTINFYTGSYTLPVKSYLLGSNSIYLLGTAKTLITTDLNGSGTGNIVLVDTTATGTLDRATSSVQGQVSGVIQDIMGLDVTRTAAPTPSTGSAPLGYADDRSARKHPTSIVINESKDQALAIDNAGNLFWLRGFYGARHQDGDAGSASSLAHQFGTIVGADHLWEDWRLGAYAGAGRTTTGLSADAGSLDADMALVGLYARRSFGAVSLDTALSGGWIWAKSERGINSGAEVARGSFDGRFVSPEAALSVKYAIAPNWTLTPSVRARYIATFIDGYGETGSSQNVRYDGHTTQSLEERFDARLSYRLVSADVLPSNLWVGGGASSTQRIGGSGYGASVSGADFTVKALGDAVVWGGTLSTGFDVRVSRSASVFGSLEGSVFSDRSQTALMRGGVKLAF